MLEQTGFFIEETFSQIGKIGKLFIQGLIGTFQLKFKFSDVYVQMVKIGIESLSASLVTGLFVGMVFAVQIANEFVKFGAGKVVGGIVAIAIARELAPILTGVVMAGRVGAGIAAEIGTMRVTQQIDALETLGASPIRYLVIPRLIAGALMLPLLTLLSSVIGFLGGYWVAAYFANINSYSYFEAAEQFMKMSDLFGGLFKAFLFGALITTISCYQGLNAKNGAKGVGESTTSAVVISLISLFIFNYFLSIAIFK